MSFFRSETGKFDSCIFKTGLTRSMENQTTIETTSPVVSYKGH